MRCSPRADASGVDRHQRSSRQSSAHRAWIKALTMLAAGAVAMLLAMPLGSDMGALDHALMRVLAVALLPSPPDRLRWTLLAITGVLMFWAGGGIFSNAARGLRHGATNMNTLVALGTSVGICLFRIRHHSGPPATARSTLTRSC